MSIMGWPKWTLLYGRIAPALDVAEAKRPTANFRHRSTATEQE